MGEGFALVKRLEGGGVAEEAADFGQGEALRVQLVQHASDVDAKWDSAQFVPVGDDDVDAAARLVFVHAVVGREADRDKPDARLAKRVEAVG